MAVVLAGCCAALLASSVDVAFAYDCETHDLVQATRMLQTERCNELEVTHSATGAFGVDPAALDDFVEALLGNQYVRKVELSDNGFGDEGVTKVMSALVQRELDLYSLEIVSNGVTDAGIPAIVEFLRKSSALRSLKLARNSITDTGASLIADSLPRQLHELDLSWNDVADTGFLSLLHAAADTMVREIELDHNAITDHGATDAAELLVEMNDSLREIDLDHNHLHADGMAALARAQEARYTQGRKIKIKTKVGAAGTVRDAAARRQGSVGHRRSPAADWDEYKVKEWVANIHPQFKKYGSLMITNAVSGPVLVSLSDADLNAMGIDNPMHRRRILAEIKQLQATDEL